MLNNEQKALLNKKEAFKGHKQQGNSTFRNIKKKKNFSYAGSLQCRSFLQARECFARESAMLNSKREGKMGLP